MGRRGRGKGKGDPGLEEEPGNQRLKQKGGAVPHRALIDPAGRPFLDLPPPLEDEVEQANPVIIHPLTPLGIPYTPPPLPMLPAFLFTPLPATAEPAEAPLRLPVHNEAAPEAPDAGPSNSHSAGTGGPLVDEGDWTPVNDRQAKKDRRTFFHTEGKEHRFHDQKAVKPASQSCEVGEHVTLVVEDVHFGNPRVRVMQSDPAPMPTMLKWSAEKFGEFRIQCAQISFGSDYRVWCAVGVQANRLLYAMKRSKVETAQAVVVPPPLAEPDEDIELTYGTCIQGIQLVP